MDSVQDGISRIETANDLIGFLHALKEDFASNRDSWENTTIESFLESMGAWLTDVSDLQQSDKNLSRQRQLPDLSETPT